MNQHASQPIDWYPWSPATFAKAKAEGKLIILSIGYSTCHWCHVMTHEVFEDTEVAAFQNRSYISIKLDREERPDIDQLYQDACRMLSGLGGWPLNVLCLPDGRPLHAVTYQSKDAWIHLLGQMRLLWLENPERVLSQAETLTEALRAPALPTLSCALLENAEPLTRAPLNILREVWSHCVSRLDPTYGGMRDAPKFPLAPLQEALLEMSSLFPDEKPFAWQQEWKQQSQTTLNALCYGGIFDQIGGGFFRYSIDAQWHIPHFEKMLYDNAQMICVLARAQCTEPQPIFHRAMLLTIEWMQHELRMPQGFYASAMDSDTDGIEGAYYAWTQEQVFSALADSPLIESVLALWDISLHGNWEQGRSIPHILRQQIQDQPAFAMAQKLKALEPARQALTAARNQRTHPQRDEKIILEWNALTAKALLDAGRILDQARLLSEGLQLLDMLFIQLRDSAGVFHRCLNQGLLGPQAFLPDLSQLCQACLTAYETTLVETWRTRAEELLTIIIHDYADPESPFFYTEPAQHAELIARRIPLNDEALASANSVLARLLIRLGTLCDQADWLERGRRMILAQREEALNNPCDNAFWLLAYLDLVMPAPQVALEGPEAQRWARTVWMQFPRAILKKAETPTENTTAQVCLQDRCLGVETELRDVLAKVGKWTNEMFI